MKVITPNVQFIFQPKSMLVKISFKFNLTFRALISNFVVCKIFEKLT